eukprot:Nk52_evm14s284 gene=Nk52_evmTU14s284
MMVNCRVFVLYIAVSIVLLGSVAQVVVGSAQNSAAAQCVMSSSSQNFARTINDVCTVCRRTFEKVCDCPAGYYCSGTPSQDCLMCPEGYSCNLANMTTPIKCGEGMFCPKNTVEPFDCPTGSVCSAGAGRPWYYLGFVYDIVIVIFVVGMVGLWNLIKKRRGVPVSAVSTPGTEEIDLGTKTHLKRTQSELLQIKDEQVDHIDLEFRNLSLTLSSGVNILAGVTGKLPSGRLTAVMGASGAGKTTFLSVLCGKVSRTGGEVLVNGKREADLSKYRRITGFVPQDDVMHRTLTVQEILTHSALTRLPRNWSYQKKMEYVEKVLTILSLTHCRDSVIGDETQRGISGGERKRVNIGMELVSAPKALFLDEPTSGLDATSASDCLNSLQNISKAGINVICVLHQPRTEIFKMFDTLLLLGKGGRTVYLGDADKAVEYFTKSLGYNGPKPHVNHADYLIDVLSEKVNRGENDDVGYTPYELANQWSGNMDPMQEEVSPDDGGLIKEDLKEKIIRKIRSDRMRTTAPFYTQFALYFYRSACQLKHESSVFLGECFLYLQTGIYLGLAFYANLLILPLDVNIIADCPTILKDQLLYDDDMKVYTQNFCSCAEPLEDNLGQMGMYVLMGLAALGAAISCRTFGEERTVYWRESSNGMHALQYFLAKNLMDCFKIAAGSVFFLSTFYFIVGPYGSFGNYFAITFMALFNFYGVSYIFTAVFQKITATLVSSVVNIVINLTAGYVFVVSSLIPWAFLFPRWLGEAIYTTEAETLSNGRPGVMAGLEAYVTTRYGYTLGRFGDDILYAFLCGVFIRIVAFTCMKLFYRSKMR